MSDVLLEWETEFRRQLAELRINDEKDISEKFNNQIMEKLEEIQNSNMKLSEEISILKNSNKENSRFNELQRTIENLKNQNGIMIEKMNEMEEKLTKIKSEKESSEKCKNQILEQLEEVQNSNAKLSEEILFLKNSNKDNQGFIEKILQKMEKIEEDNWFHELKNAVDRLTNGIGTVNEKNNLMREQSTQSTQSTIAGTQKSFKLEYCFKDVLKMAIGDVFESPVEYHYVVPWCIDIRRRDNDCLNVYLRCEKAQTDKPWSIKCHYEMKVLNPNGKDVSKRTEFCFTKRIAHGWDPFFEWSKIGQFLNGNDELTVEASVTIGKMEGIE